VVFWLMSFIRSSLETTTCLWHSVVQYGKVRGNYPAPFAERRDYERIKTRVSRLSRARISHCGRRCDGLKS